MKYLIFLFPLALFGSDVSISDSDFFERVINFVIFVAILWYLLANRIKMMMKSRQEGIASDIKSAQDKLESAKLKKQEALNNLELAKERAKEIVKNAENEAKIIANNIHQQCKSDIEIINRNHKELLSFEQRKMKKEIIGEVLDELLIDTKLSKDDYIRILLKGAA